MKKKFDQFLTPIMGFILFCFEVIVGFILFGSFAIAFGVLVLVANVIANRKIMFDKFNPKKFFFKMYALL